MSRIPLLNVAWDASVAVGAYIGIARDQFWSWLANDGYSIRLAEAVRRFEAEDRLAEKESQEEVFEPDEDLWLAETNALAKKTTQSCCPSCTDVLQAEEETSVAARQRTEEAGAPRPPVGAPAIPKPDAVVKAFIASEEKRGEIAAILQDAVGDNYDWAPSSLPPCAVLPFFHDMHADDGSVTPGFHHGIDWDGVVYDLLREFDIRKK